MRAGVREVTLLLSVLAPLAARAQTPLPQLPPLPIPPPLPFPPEPAPAAEPAAEPDASDDAEAAAPATTGDMQAEIADLRERMVDLEQRLDQTRQIATARRPIVSIAGYVDAGFFATTGNGGVGIIQDSGPASARAYGEYMNRYSWVFLGDILSTAVNSRGEAADLGDFAGIDRFDSVNSNGAPGFIINEVNLTMNAALSSSALATASVNFIPRSGHDFSIGDFIEVDLAQLEWLPFQSGKTSIFVGKFDSVVGIEYRERKANQRFGITPSLIARYTTGTPIGLKVRSKFFDDRVVVAGALTNGSSGTEQFHFYDEVDSNAGKTGSGRLSVKPVPGLDVEIGASGEYGSQDHALDSLGKLWFWGVDLLGHVGPVDIKAQYLRGHGDGEDPNRIYDPLHRPYGLDLKNGGYLELDWMVTPILGLYGRGDLRDALVWLGNPDSTTNTGADRLYITKSWRATGGVRAVINEHIVLKAEYLHNGEYGRIPQIANDVFTSSLLLLY